MFIFLDELTPEDKERFKIATKEVEKNIRTFKQTNLMNIVWKGLYYEWVSKMKIYKYNFNFVLLANKLRKLVLS